MAKKRNLQNRRRSKSIQAKRRVVRITSNPFLNFFLSACKLKGNQMVEKIARKAAVEWRKMNYLDKTPYYLLADEAKKRRKRRLKKKEPDEYRFADYDAPMLVVPRKRFKKGIPPAKSDTEIDERKAKKPMKIKQRRKSEGARKRSSVSLVEVDSCLTSDTEGVDFILETSERDLKRKKFLFDDESESSFGLSTSVSGGTLEILPSGSSLEDEDKDLRRSHDFYQ